MKTYALSLKQPWAALLVSGRKTVEVRSWKTKKLGRVFIHAATKPDARPEPWALVPEELKELASVTGGIIGAAELTGCLPYRTAEAFTADGGRHLNPPEWFEAPVLYGFVFEAAEVVPFREYPGWVRFFSVEPG